MGKQAAGNQSKYVPWLICLDAAGESTAAMDKCLGSNGLDAAKVHECQRTEGLQLLIDQAVHDGQAHQTPSVFVNGVDVTTPPREPTYGIVKAALCKADPTLKACGTPSITVVVGALWQPSATDSSIFGLTIPSSLFDRVVFSDV